mgnify:FL=1
MRTCLSFVKSKIMQKNIAAILAGGSGKRFGESQPKQFLKLRGRTVLAYTVEAFALHPLIAEVIIVVHPDYVEEVRRMVTENGWEKVKNVVSGGAERYDSTLAALKACEGREVNLLLHDAARPLVTETIITSVCHALETAEAVNVLQPVTDTIVRLDGKIAHTLPRNSLRRVQTPQGFRRELLERAYEKALADPGFAATDDCGVVSTYCPEVDIAQVAGDERNRKLTYKEDLLTLEALMPRGADCDGADLAAYQAKHLRPVQLKQLDILKQVRDLCDAHDIPYWLDGGTLLGALRHGGFIPWDDDIDIAMRGEDVARFIKIAQAELPDNLVLQGPGLKPDGGTPIYKVRDKHSFIVEYGDDFKRDYAKGLYVDIFPLIPYPDFSAATVKRLAKRYCKANAILHAQHYYSWRSAAEFVYFGAMRALCGLAWRVGGWFTKKGKYRGNYLNNNGYGVHHLDEAIFPLQQVEFEGELFSGPRDGDTYLREIFGDWRQLPPEDQRRGHAVFYLEKL